MQQIDLKSELNVKDFFHKILYLIAQKQFQVINCDIIDWSAYMSYVIQPIRAQIDFKDTVDDEIN